MTSEECKPLAILVADDNRDAAETLAMFLQLEGHEVRTVFDGQAAVDAAADQSFQLVILDLSMPVVDGYAAGRLIKGLLPEAFLVALSGHTQPQHTARTRDAGFHYHLPKPLEMRALEGIVQSLQARAASRPAAPRGHLKPDSLVRLREGSPVMCLQMLAGDIAHCFWFEDEQRQSGAFLTGRLVPAGEDQRAWAGAAPE